MMKIMSLPRRLLHKACDILSSNSNTRNTHKFIVLLNMSVGLVRNHDLLFFIFQVCISLLSLVLLVHLIEDNPHILLNLRCLHLSFTLNRNMAKICIFNLYFSSQNGYKFANKTFRKTEAVMAKWVNFLFQDHPT